jgi:hypothetical protein
MSSEEATVSTDFTQELIRDAASLLANHYGQAVQKGRLESYERSVQRLMQAVASELVAQEYFSRELADVAVPKAVGFVQRGGRW